MAGVVGAMAGEVGAAVLQALVQNLIDLTKKLISQINGLDGEAQNLSQNLLTIKQFLNDAETRTITSGDVKTWLKRLENAAFEADEILDELHYYDLSSKLNTGITKKKVLFGMAIQVPRPITDNDRKRKMGDSIEAINTKLKSINESATQLGLDKKLADAPTVPYAGMETDSFSADPIFIGRDEVVSEIVETLTPSVATHHQRVFSILSIVGMGGLGKTTLTRKVFHHQKMETQFRSRIWVHVSPKEGKSIPITKEVAQHLRTLIFQTHHQLSGNIFSDFKCLHVLTLEGYSFGEFPRSIRKLIHLRNLNIQFTSIGDLPDWIGELHHLQTLRAKEVWILPSTIKYLINLRHLHVDDRYVKLPAEIGRLTSLQTLPANEFIVRDENGYKIEELGSLNNLKGSLTIEYLEKVHDKEEAEQANLSKKSKLSELMLWWSYDREEVESINDENVLEWDDDREEVESINDENVLEGLQPHSNLKKLEIWGFRGKRFPDWTLKMAVRNEPQGSWVGLNQLVEIEFNRCTKCEEIPMLGHLPKLKSLCLGDLSNVKSINSSFYGISNETGVVFPVLETLELFGMDSLKEWAEVESGSTSEVKVFPHLRSLKISNCNQLTTDSYLALLSKLTWLEDLVLEGLNGLESLPDELFYNNPHLSVLKIRKCPTLREIPDGLQSLYLLNELIIEECPDLTQLGIMDFPYEIFESLCPKKVALEGLSSLRNLPRLIECLVKSTARLMELTIVGVPKFLGTSVDQVWHFPELLELKIDVSMEGSRDTSVATLDRILQGCSRSYLCKLYLTGMDSWECLPESIQHLTFLKELELNNFGMEELPEWFDQYISCTNPWVFNLKLSECKRLRHLPSTPEMQHLIKTKRVHITGCPKLTTK